MPRYNLDDYETVDARIDTFWEKHPNGVISTTLVSDPNIFNRVVFKAEVYVENDGQLMMRASGYAAEEQGTGGANNTSWHENAETSAIGRALANMGYATTKNRPSREEMAKVNRGEERQPVSDAASHEPPPQTQATGARVPGGASVKQVNFINVLAKEAGMDDIELHEFIKGETGKESRNDLTGDDASKLIGKLQPLANNPRD